MTTIDDRPSTNLTPQEREWVDRFMDETTLFLGPDPAIMRDHSIAPRSAHKEVGIAAGVDRFQVERIRKRIAGALDEATRCARRRARSGATTTAIYTAAGDVSY